MTTEQRKKETSAFMVRDGSCGQSLRGEAGRLGLSHAANSAGLATLCLAETLWPTRCIVCNAPGEVLCELCRKKLPYIDQWMACPRCGAPYGRLQCTECNTYSQRSFPAWDLPRGQLPFVECVSAVRFDDAAARIARGCKDEGEQRLSLFMAYAMACAVPPEWLARSTCVTCVPATRAALGRRGFDHGKALQDHLARLLALPARSLLVPGRVRDQRGLGRQERFANMRGCFRAAPRAPGEPPCTGGVILVDDVYTTGATLMSASETLLEQGFCQVRCVTFARVY